MRRDWIQFLPKLSEQPWLPCTWRWGGKSQHWPEPLKSREPMGTKQMPPPLQTGLVEQLFKVNKVNFSNPKRILKPLLICLPFCFVCSAQVKGNLTFGILTANNPHQGQGLAAAVSACGSQGWWGHSSYLQRVLEDTLHGGPQGAVPYPKGRAVPNSLDFSAPRPGRGRGDAVLDE